MEEVFPQLVKEVVQKQDSEKIFEYKGISYIGLISLLTRAIQDQQNEINELKEQINKLSASLGKVDNLSSSKTN